MTKRLIISIGFIIAVTFLSACGMQYSRLDMDYGTSFKLAKINQIANPEAEKNLKPVYGFDGQAAQIIMERFRKDFEKAAPAAYPTMPVSLIGVGLSGKK